MILFVVHLAGAVALLLWAVRLIRTGVERAFMSQMRVGLRRASQRPATAALGGAAAAIMMQSSTAVAMLAAAFAATGALPPVAGLALLLGADVGSAIVAQILLSPLTAIVPLLLLVGVGLSLRAKARGPKQTGRILIGLALVLLSLQMIRTATEPLRDSPFVGIVVSYLESDLFSAFAMGALLAWAMHSSVAAVLTFVTFAAEGLLPALPAVALVLGANLGGAAIPFILTLSAPMVARRVIVSNLILRGGGAVLVLLGLVYATPDLSIIGKTAARQVINAHLLFNLALAVVAMPLVAPMLHLAGRLLPDVPGSGPGRLSALDLGALAHPERALVCATRELLRMGESVHGMLSPTLRLLRDWDEVTAQAIAASENQVDRMHFEIKLYVAHLQEHPLTPAQARRALDIATIANNLEDAGDQVSTHLVDVARRMQREGLSFSDGGWSDLTDFHDCVLGNAQLALNVLMTNDLESARQLVEEKDRIRKTEQTLQARHLDRLRTGTPSTVETSNLHQETLRALKQINTAFSLVAYPIAEEAGDLLSSRLTATPGPV